MNVGNKEKFWLALAAGGSVAGLIFYSRRGRRTVDRALLRAKPSRLVQDRSRYVTWRFDNRFQVLPAGKALRIELTAPAIVRWSTDGWDHVRDTRTTRLEPGVHVADLDISESPAGSRVQFTFYWPEVNRWEGEDFEARVEYATAYGSPVAD